MQERIPQSIAKRFVFKTFLSADHVTAGGAALTIPVQISKNGGAFANLATPANATSVGNGWYYIDLAIADTGTLGPLVVRGTEATIDPAEIVCEVVAATNAGFTALPAYAADAAHGLPVSDAGGLDMDAMLADTNELQGLWTTGGALDLLLKDVPSTSEFNARTLAAADYFIVSDYVAIGSPMQAGNVTVGGYAANQGPLYLLTGGTYALAVDANGKVAVPDTQHVIVDSGTVTTVTNQLTAAQIATGVWQDATAGDFAAASSIGKSLFTSGVVPGGAGGIAIVGSAMTNATLTKLDNIMKAKT